MVLYFGSYDPFLTFLKPFSVMNTSKKHALMYGFYLYKANVNPKSLLYLRSYHDNRDLSAYYIVVPRVVLTRISTKGIDYYGHQEN